jgi:hypothetical protein
VLLLAAIAASVTGPRLPARVTARIVRAQAVTKQDWERLGRKREIVRSENERPLRIRLIEFE